MIHLVATTLYQQFEESARLDLSAEDCRAKAEAAIKKNLKGLGYGE